MSGPAEWPKVMNLCPVCGAEGIGVSSGPHAFVCDNGHGSDSSAEVEVVPSRPVREALEELVALKDGPRDAEYERRKPLAWAAARAALSGLGGVSVTEGETQWLGSASVEQFIKQSCNSCPECGEEMKRTDWPGDTWVYRCPNGHELGIGK